MNNPRLTHLMFLLSFIIGIIVGYTSNWCECEHTHTSNIRIDKDNYSLSDCDSIDSLENVEYYRYQGYKYNDSNL